MASPLPGIPPAPEIEGVEHVHSGKVRDLYRLPDGNLLMVASYRISAYAPVYVASAPPAHVADTRANFPYGRRLATGDRDGNVRVWDTATGQILATFHVSTGPVGVYSGYAIGIPFVSMIE